MPSYREKEGWGRLLHTGEEKVGEGCSLQGKSGLGGRLLVPGKEMVVEGC